MATAPKYAPVKLSCADCGEYIILPWYRCRIAQNHFCNYDCHISWRIKNVKRMKFNCDKCGKLVRKVPSKSKRYKNYYCGRNCLQSVKEKYPEPCSYCSKAVLRWKHLIGTTKTVFCNKECYLKYYSDLLKCNECNKEFYRSQYRQADKDRQWRHTFCSQICFIIFRERNPKTKKEIATRHTAKMGLMRHTELNSPDIPRELIDLATARLLLWRELKGKRL